VSFFVLMAQAIAVQAVPTTIYPQGPKTFNEQFSTWNAGPDATDQVTPLHRWRTIDKSGSASMFNHATLVSDAAFSLQPGPYLAITATKGADGQWRSGYASTKFSFKQLRGYFEFDANLPVCTKGAWPGLWMLPTEASFLWPRYGEIDLAETVGDGRIYQTIHSIVLGTPGSFASSAPCTRGWHTYGVLWRKSTISFYVDRKLTNTVATPADFTSPMYLIMDLAMGGAWAGTPTVTRESMLVRRVSAWGEQ
jgi:beta-glucanase (GH16 family)